MPTYEHYCQSCDSVTEDVCMVADRKQFVVCKSCGGSAERIMSTPAIRCDSGTDVPWLASACKTLQKDGEQPIESRSQYKRYLKDKGIVERC